MRPSRIKAKLRRGESVLLTQLHLRSPEVFELTSLMGFDGIWIDLEHHHTSVETAEALIRASRVGVSDVVARVARGELMRLGRLLEAGAAGIMYARCGSADEAREVVAAAKFAPLGRRGFDGGGADMPYCSMPMDEYVRRANDETFIIVQIEDAGALADVDAIAAVEGVDVLFFGPADFSVLAGTPGRFDGPVIDDALRRIASAAREAGIVWGMPAFSVDHARRLLDLGARFLTHGADIVMVKAALERMQQDFGAVGFRFDNRLASPEGGPS